MSFKNRGLLLVLAGLVLLAGPAMAELKQGTADLKSAGPLAFGPEGVLLVGDPAGSAVFAIDTGDKTAGGTGSVKIDGINNKVGALLGTDGKQILINDVAVNPVSGNVYLSVARGRGPDAKAVILKVDRSGKIAPVSLKSVKFDKVQLPNTGKRYPITDIGFVDGKVLVAGLSNEDWASTLRAIPYPFKAAEKGAGIQIFHGAHGRFETRSPVRTFAAYEIDKKPYLLAAYTCTPLVKIPVADLKAGAKVKGTTIAELGNRNRPLDMIVYNKDGKDFILIANSARGIMKVTTDDIAKFKGLTEKVSGGKAAGIKYETIKAWKGVQQLAKLDKANAIVLLQTPTGLNLETLPLP